MILFGIDNLNRIIGVISVVVVFLINIVVFHLYERLMESYDNKMAALAFEQEKEYYYNQCRYMESSTENTRCFKHDIKNHLLTVVDFIKNGNNNEAERYLYNMIGHKLGDIISYSDTGNIAIDSVINYKLNEAESNHIKIEADIDIPNNLLLDPSDITSMVGNLLDNAINATRLLDDNERSIYVNLYYDKGRLFINIENTFDGKVIERNGKIVTRNIDKLNHGYGLKNVEKTIEKYDGDILYEHKENTFNVMAMMYVKETIAI